MKKFKRLSILLLAVAMTVLLAACGSTGGSGTGTGGTNTGTITYESSKLAQFNEKAKNGYTANLSTYMLDDDTPITQKVVSYDGWTYIETSFAGYTTVSLSDGSYSYTLDKSNHTYTKEAKTSSSVSLPSKSEFLSTLKIGRTTVRGETLYSETYSAKVSGQTMNTAVCFDASGNIRYVVMYVSGVETITVRYDSISYTCDKTLLSLDGYKAAN